MKRISSTGECPNCSKDLLMCLRCSDAKTTRIKFCNKCGWKSDLEFVSYKITSTTKVTKDNNVKGGCINV